MSWFPSFLNPWVALACAAVAAPLLLLLYFLKLRRRETAVSSTLLWKKAIQDLQVNAPFQKLRRNLLLLLQLLLLLLLCLALSRPISHYTRSAGKLSVILIDRSASMSANDIFEGQHRTRLTEAKRQAKILIDSMEKGDSATVMAFDDSAEVILPFTTDTVRLKSAVDSIEPTDRASRLKTAYKLADAQAAFNPEQLRAIVTPNVYLYSDGRVLDAAELKLQGNLIYTPIGSSDLPNVAIVALSAKRNYERPAEVQVFARLANYGPEPVAADVELRVDGDVRGEAMGEHGCYLYPERWSQDQREKYDHDTGRSARDSVDFPKIELTQAAVIRLQQIHAGGDALAADDIASVIVPPPKSLSVLLVTDGNMFLEKAINSMSLKHPDMITPSAYEQQKPTKYDVIIFDHYPPKWMPSSGNFMYFGALPDGLKLKAVKKDGKNVMLPQARVLDWDRDHPILRGLLLSKLEIAESMKLDIPPSAQVLMEGYKGPLIVLDREGRSTHLLVAFDLLQSDWPFKFSFPAFMNNALQFLALGSDMDVRQSYSPGATPRIPRPNLLQAGSPRQIRLDGPMGLQVLNVADDNADFVLPALNKVGVYTLNPPIPQFEKIAVNLLDPNESNLIPELLTPGGIGDVASTKSKARLDLWWWIVACGALPLLMIEWWVYTLKFSHILVCYS